MSRVSVGEVLRQEREERHISIEEVSSTTRIPRRTLESLEKDRFEELPSGVFVRGFIKAYASAVDIDADEVLARFDEQEPQTISPSPFPVVERGRRFGPVLLAIAMAAFFAIVVVTFALVRRSPAQEDPIELSSTTSWPAEVSKVARYSSAPSTTVIRTASSRS
jgi:cytoskeletal protein RodZ